MCSAYSGYRLRTKIVMSCCAGASSSSFARLAFESWPHFQQWPAVSSPRAHAIHAELQTRARDNERPPGATRLRNLRCRGPRLNDNLEAWHPPEPSGYGDDRHSGCMAPRPATRVRNACTPASASHPSSQRRQAVGESSSESRAESQGPSSIAISTASTPSGGTHAKPVMRVRPGMSDVRAPGLSIRHCGRTSPATPGHPRRLQ